ncbi:amidohydrolase family protein [Qingshengfaniella alkalisoli]|uniref:amidohydrolase family protein n=1 Tax=Qingshengfaniella alkalisoli TaxID=2599296 RepID=UPI001F101F2F|nr:amidohydrolase [Qingshengfaniella alkalisoli]
MTLLTNARILTMDADMTEIERGWIRIDGDRITALGTGTPDDITGATDMGGDLVMPGMVNPHSHIAMTLFRGLGEDVDDRLFRYILPLERECVTADAVSTGARLATLELIRGGVTTVADMYYFEAEIGRAVADAGIRGVVGQTLGNFDAPDHDSFDQAFALTDALVDEFRNHPRVTPSIAPHAPYSTGPEIMARVARWAADNPGVPVQMHLGETDGENDWSREHGGTPVEITDRAGLLIPGLIAAHCLHVSDSDISLMAERGVGVAHNARANGKGGRGIAPVTEMRGAGIPVGISTDGPMSSNTLDLFSQFAPVSMFQKLRGHSRKPMPSRDVIRMASIEGAQVLGMADRIGSLEVGKQADLIRISLDDPRLQPVYDIYSTLVFAAGPSDIRATMVAGEWLMQDRQMITLETARIMSDARQVAHTFGAKIAEIDRRST